jgi:hypothetical protein
MVININDKVIDKKLEELQRQIKHDFNIKNCSKIDTIRFLLKINKQGKKTNKKWKKIII